MSLVREEYDSRAALNESFAATIESILCKAIEKNGEASIAFSGGSTPKPLFETLSKSNIDWDKVTVTLVDDRWLDATHKDSNENLIKSHLLVGKAAAARFISLKTEDASAFDAEQAVSQRFDAISKAFDIVILGMGEDGHTASLFPCCEQIDEGLNLSRAASAIATKPTTAPYERMSMSLKTILNAEYCFLHLTGQSKKDVLDDALENGTEQSKPIKAVIDNRQVTLMWAA